MQHGGGDRVGAHGHPADGDDIRNLGDEVEHDLADQRRHPVVEADLAQVDVVRGLLAAGQGEVSVEDGVGRDEVDKLRTHVSHPPILRGRAGAHESPARTGRARAPVNRRPRTTWQRRRRSRRPCRRGSGSGTSGRRRTGHLRRSGLVEGHRGHLAAVGRQDVHAHRGWPEADQQRRGQADGDADRHDGVGRAGLAGREHRDAASASANSSAPRKAEDLETSEPRPSTIRVLFVATKVFASQAIPKRANAPTMPAGNVDCLGHPRP